MLAKTIEKTAKTTERKSGSASKPASVILTAMSDALERDGVALLPPQDVKKTLALARQLGYHFDTVMLDPWYNKGFGGVQDDYLNFFLDVIRQSGEGRSRGRCVPSVNIVPPL